MPELSVAVDPAVVEVDDEFTVTMSVPRLTRQGPTTAEFVLAIDASPSMTWPAKGDGEDGPTRWDLARDGATALLGAIAADATVHVVLFADKARHLDSGTAAELRVRLARTMPASPPPEHQGTNIEAALREAHSRLSGSTATSRVIVLLSDGEPNMGRTRPEDLAAISSAATAQDIYTKTIGFGVGVNIDLLKQIASSGDPAHVRSMASTSGAVEAIMSEVGAAGQDTVAAGGSIEAVVSPHFPILGVYQLTPARRRLTRAVRTQPDGASVISISTGPIGADDDRPVFGVRLRAPSRSNQAPVPLLLCSGKVRTAGGQITLTERTVMVQLTVGRGGDVVGEALDIMRSIDLEEETEQQVDSAPPEQHEQIYRAGLQRARQAGLQEQAAAFDSALRQLGQGEDARDVRNEYTATSSKGVTRARSLLLEVPTVQQRQRADGPPVRAAHNEDDEDWEPLTASSPTRSRREYP